MVAQQHKRLIHDRAGESVCPMCSKKFITQYTMKRHFKSAHAWPQFYCKQCPHVYKRKDDLDRHVKAVHFEVQKCPFCPSQMKAEMLDTHIRWVHHMEITIVPPPDTRQTETVYLMPRDSVVQNMPLDYSKKKYVFVLPKKD